MASLPEGICKEIISYGTHKHYTVPQAVKIVRGITD